MTITVNISGLEPIAEAVNNLARSLGASGVTSAVKDPAMTVQQPVPAPRDTAPQVAQTAAPAQQPLPVQQVASAPAPVQQAVPAAVPTSAVTYTLDDLSKAGMTLMDSGRQNDLLGLLAQFGVTSLPELPAAQYGAFATALRGLGAQI